MVESKRFHRTLTLGGVLFALSITPAFASNTLANETDSGDMMGSEMEPDVMEPDVVTIPSDDAARNLLLDTALRDDARDLADADLALADAQAALDAAIKAGDPIDLLEDERDDALAAFKREGDESQAVTEAILALSDQQVRNLNRALNDTRHNGRVPNLDAATFEEIAERDLGHREIQALTKALEEEAKALQQAERFERKYDETGKEHFLAKRDRALDRGERQNEKFDAKVDRFADGREQARDGAKVQARDHGKDVARGQARDAAKQNAKANAKNNAKDNAKDVAKNNAKDSAKDTARLEARRAARDEARSNGRGRN